MLFTQTVTKKVLETIVRETFTCFGNLSSSSLLDSLKFLGFYYATNAGISINVEDLKTPNVKKEFLKAADEEVQFVSKQWEQGFVSDTERFQSIIDSWNVATESLKNRIVDYYQHFDPANNLYIMAFSGARGNMSQVRQLVGMRGLMSDQEGKIIDLPIQTNFREGLSSIDYIISSYGARKGIVDTALKTADSGYLTRRLIYVAQDLIIREIDCNSKRGVIILLNKQTNTKNILGRLLLAAKSIESNQSLLVEKNKILNEKSIKSLREKAPIALNIRSSLTCQSSGSICQNCYGWDLAQNKLISLGEAVGIIAAQSIGEPGTQLTMRTFHTGGIFTSEMLRQTVAPFTGRIDIPKSLKMISYRTNHGNSVAKLQQETTLTIRNWKGVTEEIFLDIGSFLYISGSSFLKKGELIAEYSTRSTIPGVRRLKPIYTPINGEIRFESLLVRYIHRDDKPKVKVNQADGILWLASGKIFPLPKEAFYLFKEKLSLNRPFATLKIITPCQGFLIIENETIVILNKEKNLKLNLLNLNKVPKNCKTKLVFFVKNYQYVDKHTIVGALNFYSKFEGKVYGIRKKDSKFISSYFLITESDIWKANSDKLNSIETFENYDNIRAGALFNATSESTKSGFLLKKDGFKHIFQKAIPIFLSGGTILNYKQGDFVFSKQLLATLVNYTQQTEDIVQGLPKIEELIEARIPKIKAELALRPGIFLSPMFVQTFKCSKLKNEIIFNTYERMNLLKQEKYVGDKVSMSKTSPKKKTQDFDLIHSAYNNKEFILFEEKLWKAYPLPPGFFPFQLTGKTELCFINANGAILLINIKGKKISSGWIKKSLKTKNLFLYLNKNGRAIKWKKLKKNNLIYFNNKSKDCILKTKANTYLFLEHANPIYKYTIPLSKKVSLKPGAFIDLGEPITEGLIDPHELLAIFYKYHYTLDGTYLGTLRSLNKFQLLLVNSVQSIYQSQGVNISSKHIEIIIRQMTAKVIIKESGDTPLLPGELIKLPLILEIHKALCSEKKLKNYRTPKYEPILLSTTNSSLSKDGFLSAAGFQETKRVLTKAAIEGTTDWLRGLKECIIIGRLIPAGTTFLNYKNYLDNIYTFKN